MHSVADLVVGLILASFLFLPLVTFGKINFYPTCEKDDVFLILPV
jgi:hypothetical protein